MKRTRAVSSLAKRAAATRQGAAWLPLQSFLPYRLNAMAQVVSDGFAVAYSETFGLSPPEWRVLATLGEFWQMSAKEVGQHSRMHKTRVSRAVLSLEKRRLLTRSPSVADRREEILSLSTTGREIYEAVAPMAIRYQQHLLSGLSDADQAKFDHLIRHLMERASAPWRLAPLPHHRKR